MIGGVYLTRDEFSGWWIEGVFIPSDLTVDPGWTGCLGRRDFFAPIDDEDG